MKPRVRPAPRCKRILWSGAFHPAHANINLQHPAEAAAWIWAEDWHPRRAQVLRFRRGIRLKQDETIRLHVSADQRFQLLINGALIASGPDRSDVEHWSVASYEIELPAGRHEFIALVWWLPEAPLAQMTWRGGFLFCAEGEWHASLSTGFAPWRIEELSEAVSLAGPAKALGFHAIGESFSFSLAKWNRGHAPRKTTVVEGPLADWNLWGTRRGGWRLCPTPLPEQRSELHAGGRIRAVREGWSDAPFEKEDGAGPNGAATSSSPTTAAGMPPLPRRGDIPVVLSIPATRTSPLRVSTCGQTAFSRLLAGKGPVRVPPHTTIEILWDFEDYLCGYPALEVAGGAGAEIEFLWAESLYASAAGAEPTSDTPKAARPEIAGKRFLGFGDRWRLDGSAGPLPALWWRSGRYARIRIRTTDTPLALRSLAVRATGYPLELSGRFACDDRAWTEALPLMERGLLASAHETWVDCPHYEQLCYVGDAVTESAAAQVVSRDGRLTRRCLQLFDWSRGDGGLVAERYPSRARQESATYAMLYPRILREHLFWRGEEDFVSERLPGLRALIEQCLALRKPDGRVGRTPGWPFVDWVQGWKEGCGPGVREGDSSLLDLHLILALQDHADIEAACGDARLARRSREIARDLRKRTRTRFWDTRRGLLADDAAKRHFSEHAQALALITGLLDAADTRRCLRAWLARREELAPASIYFSFHVLEALYRAGAAEEFHRRLGFWKGLKAQGFLTPPERPEPSRSDCHGWGAHPLFHSYASIAGIRPTAPGFARVRIAPLPGPMRRVEARMPHPRGQIEVKLDLDRARATVTLPRGVAGDFVLGGVRAELRGGANRIALAG